MIQDRRRFQRVPLDVPMRVLLANSHNGFVLDLCEDGLAVCAPRATRPGEILPFVFDLPEGSGQVRGKCEVISCSASGQRTGLHFLELAEPDRRRLTEWISSRAWTMRLAGVEQAYDQPAEVSRRTSVPADAVFANRKEEGDRSLPGSSASVLPRAGFESDDWERAMASSNWKSSPLLRVGLATAALLLGLRFFFHSSRGTRTTQVNESTGPAPVQSTASSSKGLVPSVPAPSTATETPVPTVRVKADPGFVLQVAAMTQQANANALAMDLQKKNFPAFVFRGGSATFYRVGVGPFRNKESPAKVRDALEKEGLKPFLKPWAPE